MIKILKTNWVNLAGVFIAVFIYAIYLNLTDVNVSRNILQSILPALFLIVLYGLMFWVGFVVALIVLDLIVIGKEKSQLTGKLLVEWFVISSPFIYWTFNYHEWIFLVAVVTFLITQMVRKTYLDRVLVIGG